MKSLVVLLLAMGLLLVTPACNKEKQPSPEESCDFQQNAYLQRVSWAWAKHAVVVMYADPSLSADEVESLQKAMTIWNETFVADFGYEIFSFGGVLPEVSVWGQDGRNVVSVTADWTGAANEQAETLLTWRGKAIVDGDIRLNARKNLATSDEVAPDQLDTVSLLVHELGHVLGLAHHVADYTVMAERLGAGTVDRRSIGSVDVDALKCEY